MMQEFDIDEKLADPADIATRNEMLANHARIARMRIEAESSEQPDIDENGVRYCLDCATAIPEDRITVLPTAVRCVPCAAVRERMMKQHRARGGINADGQAQGIG
ncbi:TraR/DksA C4-type zinc finger protein [Acidithiobacillus ferrianus]|uniref:TraR/DksA C4-type zinc finger protein n=1 Tax=Acidithiobacillus ferrianus TaxID=2678518 RepID=UPI0034E50741